MPCSRIAGPAMIMPTGTVSAAAMSRPSTLPLKPHSTTANAPKPTRVICARLIWLAQPVSGTRDSITNAVRTMRVTIRMLVRSRVAAQTAAITMRAAKPSSALRVDGMRSVVFRGLDRPLIRASLTNSTAMKSRAAGMADAADVHRPVQLRKFSWNESVRPMIRPPT